MMKANSGGIVPGEAQYNPRPLTKAAELRDAA